MPVKLRSFEDEKIVCVCVKLETAILNLVIEYFQYYLNFSKTI